MISFNKQPEQKILELGGGANRHPQADVNVDARSGPGVNFIADFNQPLPINSDEWDGVICQYALEHISWRNIRSFLKEVLRILKPNGKAIFITANTEAQLKWIQEHKGEGWDGKDSFDSCSCVLFGDLDYPENSHKSYFSPDLIITLFQEAGFEKILVQPWGERKTDMVIEAMRPSNVVTEELKVQEGSPKLITETLTSEERASLFDRHYFDGGRKVGGYAADQFGAYRDFPCHEITANYILDRKPESVLEIGCGRGYILKRIQDAGVRASGLEISKHCFMTRVADGIIIHDLCNFPWPNAYRPGVIESKFDLAFSIATLEHIPEEFLPSLIKEMALKCKRGLHGIDFGERDDGFDKTHCSLHHKNWWEEQFNKHAPGWPVEILNKEELEKANWTAEALYGGDGRVKLNVGSFVTMFHHGWINIDIHDLSQFAQMNHYIFQRLDVRQGLSYPTGGVDLIMMCHFLEHLTYQEGLSFLRECRRVIKPNGCMRIIVPDANLLCSLYTKTMESNGDLNDTVIIGGDQKSGYIRSHSFSDFDEINEGCAASSAAAGKLWSLLFSGHQAAYDSDTLNRMLQDSGFEYKPASFRQGHPQILKETLDLLPCLSLYVEALPLLT